MTTQTDNIETSEPAHTFEIKAYSPTLAAIDGLREKYNYIPDCSTKEGLAEVKADYRIVRKFETTLESKRKDLGESARKKLTLINDEAKLIDAKIKEISAPLKAAFEKREAEIKAHEQKRQDELEAKVNKLKGFENTEGMDSAAISAVIEAVTEIDCSVGFYEFTESALVVRKQILSTLAQRLNEVILQEQMAIERQALRIEREEAATLARVNELKAQAQTRLNNLMMIPTTMFGKTSKELKSKIDAIMNVDIDPAEFGELTNNANTAIKTVSQQLYTMLQQQENIEAFQEAQATALSLAQQVVTEKEAESTVVAKESLTSVDKEVVPSSIKAKPIFTDVIIPGVNREKALKAFLSTLDNETFGHFVTLFQTNDDSFNRRDLSIIKESFDTYLRAQRAA